MSAILHRLEALERDKPSVRNVLNVPLPQLNKLTEEERLDLCTFAFCSDGSRPWPTHRKRHDDAYYEALMTKAMGINAEGMI